MKRQGANSRRPDAFGRWHAAGISALDDHVAWLEARIRELERENARLSAELGKPPSSALDHDSAPIATEAQRSAGAASPDARARTPSRTPAEKIALFRARFVGREDLYARRWESQGGTRSGYAPVCTNEWRPGVCRKPEVSCHVCAHRAFEPVTDDAVRRHLRGEQVMGLYALDAASRTRFVVNRSQESMVRERERALGNAAARAEAPAEAQRRLATTEADVGRALARERALAEQNAALAAERDARTREVEALTSEREVTGERLASLETARDAERAQRAAAEQALAAREAELAAAHEAATAAERASRQAIGALETRLAAREEALATARAEQAALAERLAAAERTSGAAEARAKDLERRVLTLRDAERASDTLLAEALERLERRLGANNDG